MIQLKTADEIALMRRAGLVVAGALRAVRGEIRAGVSTQDLDDVAERYIRGQGATPSFLGYHGFPASICASVNEEIVHGIPLPTRRLREGDVISIDCGAIVDGYHGDAAITVPVGDVSSDVLELLRVTEMSLWAGLAAARLGGRLGDLSHAIEQSLRAHDHDYGIVRKYGGHGIGTEMHQDPHVLNYGRPGRGSRLVRGLALAVEPMVTLGRPDTVELDDGWTVVSVDGSYAAHFEHTFTLTDEGPWVLTAEDGGAAKLAEFGLTVPARGQPT
ncbi:MAG: type I methionyl aminopeptidase [Geodermatophilaceae bacterium]|nr:type I methionyl aminopeptidase [Geodermatophilaceae bacterium]